MSLFIPVLVPIPETFSDFVPVSTPSLQQSSPSPYRPCWSISPSPTHLSFTNSSVVTRAVSLCTHLLLCLHITNHSVKKLVKKISRRYTTPAAIPSKLDPARTVLPQYPRHNYIYQGILG